MPFDGIAVLDAIRTLVATAVGIDAVTVGAPLAIGPKVSAYITQGHQPQDIKTQSTVWRDSRYFVDLCYRISDNLAQIEEAERGIIAALDAIQQAIYLDKTLGGVCDNTIIETGMADTPDYRVRSGLEYREFPLILICRQYSTYDPTP